MAFVVATWLHSMRGGPVAKALGAEWSRVWREVVYRIVSDRTPLLAVSEDDPTLILGWIAGGPERLDYVYVRKSLRGAGIAKDLWMRIGSPRVVSHVTRRELPEGWTYRSADAILALTGPMPLMTWRRAA